MRLQGLEQQIQQITTQANQAKDLELERDNLKDQKLKDQENHKKLQDLVDHLQIDLNQVQQDKNHLKSDLAKVQKVLNDSKKATREIGTQTELTAEQIAKLEAELKNLKEVDLPKLNQERRQQEGELNRQIAELKAKSLNETEKFILEKAYYYSYGELESKEELIKKAIQELQTGIGQGVYIPLGQSKDWSQLSPNFYNLKSIKDLQLRNYLEVIENKKKVQDLQTKLDLATETKENLIKFLTIYRNKAIVSFDFNSSEPFAKEILRKHNCFQHFDHRFYLRQLVYGTDLVDQACFVSASNDSQAGGDWINMYGSILVGFVITKEARRIVGRTKMSEYLVKLESNVNTGLMLNLNIENPEDYEIVPLKGPNFNEDDLQSAIPVFPDGRFYLKIKGNFIIWNN